MLNRNDASVILERHQKLSVYFNSLLSVKQVRKLFEVRCFFELLDLSRKVFIITGATGYSYTRTHTHTHTLSLHSNSFSSFGQAIAGALARQRAHVVLACRDVQAGHALAEQLKDQSNMENVTCLQLELTSQSSIRQFAQGFLQLNIPLYALINCAGTLDAPSRPTEDGLNPLFASNYLGTFLLTHLLCTRSKVFIGEADASPEASMLRVVNLGCAAHKYATRVIPSELRLEAGAIASSGIAAYLRAKLTTPMFTRSLSERLPHVYAACVSPGFCPSSKLYRSHSVIQTIFETFKATTPDESLLSVLFHAVAADKATSQSGAYYEEGLQCDPHKAALDRGECDKLWQWSLLFTSQTD